MLRLRSKLPKYVVSESIHEIHRRRYRRRLWFAALLLLVIAGASLYIYSNFEHTKNTPFQKSIGAAYVHTIAGPQVFHSKYFEFSASEPWQFTPKQSSSNKFTYLL